MTNDQLRQWEASFALRGWQFIPKQWALAEPERLQAILAEPPLVNALTLTPDDVTFLRVNGIKPW